MFPDVDGGHIAAWHVRAGDVVASHQTLVEVETAAAVVAIPSPRSGTVVSVHGRIGDSVGPGDVLVTFADGVLASPDVSVAPAHGRVRATPAARRLAAELGVDLSSVSGTGPHGVIVPADVKVVSASEDVSSERLYDFYGYVEKKPGKVADGWSSDCATSLDKFDVTALVALFESEKKKMDLTYVPFFVSACCKALAGFPSLNASYVDGEILLKKYYHIGIASGDAVPVVRGADKKSVKALAVELGALDHSPEGCLGGSFTLQSRDSGEYFTPRLYNGQSGSVGFSALRQEPVYRSGRVDVRWMLPVSLSYDPRVVSSEDAAGFLSALGAFLCDPGLLG